MRKNKRRKKKTKGKLHNKFYTVILIMVDLFLHAVRNGVYPALSLYKPFFSELCSFRFLHLLDHIGTIKTDRTEYFIENFVGNNWRIRLWNHLKCMATPVSVLYNDVLFSALLFQVLLFHRSRSIPRKKLNLLKRKGQEIFIFVRWNIYER